MLSRAIRRIPFTLRQAIVLLITTKVLETDGSLSATEAYLV